MQTNFRLIKELLMYRKEHFISIFVFPVLVTLLLGAFTPAFSENGAETDVSFTLQLLHAADMEGDIEALDNAPRFSSVLNALKAEFENTVIIGAGDSYIPGPFSAAGNDQSLRDILGREGSGRADILILNGMGFMAAALGNHEFDTGTGTLAGLIRNDGRGYAGTAFPLLSANLDFSLDSNFADLVVDAGQEASTIPNSITKSVVITTSSDEKIGVVGITTPWLGSLSKSGDVGIAPEDPDDIVALAAIVQESVDALTATGIDSVRRSSSNMIHQLVALSALQKALLARVSLLKVGRVILSTSLNQRWLDLPAVRGKIARRQLQLRLPLPRHPKYGR